MGPGPPKCRCSKATTRSLCRSTSGPPGDQIFLLLAGTGIRGFTSAVTASIEGSDIPVLGAQDQGEFAGLDQVNIGPLPRNLPKGNINLALTVDGRETNTVTVNIQ